jgi:hypothetical protein
MGLAWLGSPRDVQLGWVPGCQLFTLHRPLEPSSYSAPSPVPDTPLMHHAAVPLLLPSHILEQGDDCSLACCWC